MTNLNLTVVIPAKRSAEPGPESRGVNVSVSERQRDLGSPVPDLRFAFVRDDDERFVKSLKGAPMNSAPFA